MDAGREGQTIREGESNLAQAHGNGAGGGVASRAYEGSEASVNARRVPSGMRSANPPAPSSSMCSAS